MRMAWWLFMALLSIQIIFLQYMVEEYLAEEYDELVYYFGALGFVFLCGILIYLFFQKTDKVSEE
ncbi:hypothetical protein HHO41_02815 [Bacillus sp. DNRA2]|uniref:hypothetical protein n=1 Tax=Bacillus sp. DNRA2 TaxID=2723053 RepID=UPI00145D9C06|nr:hypothetical protein [Bacillus sp. DNRA2]NMD69206.1 hypothetical protein [Bacillus sp. DNRA2]